MTPIEQLAKDYREFHGDSEAIEKAFLEGAKQARLQDIEVLRDRLKISVEYNSIYSSGIKDSIETLEELL